MKKFIKRLKGAWSVLIGKSEATRIYKPTFKPNPDLRPKEPPKIKPRFWGGL